MKRVDEVYREGPPLGDVVDGAGKGFSQTFGQLSSDARNLGSALADFPYGSAFRVIGVVTIVYIAFKVLGHFVNIESTLKKAIRGE